MFSCGEEPMSPEEQAAQALLDDPRPKLLMTMSDDLELTINLQKFTETVSYMTFHIMFDPEALELVSYSAGDFGNPWSNMDAMDVNNDSVYCSFTFSSDISGSGDLLKLKFNAKSSSSYEDSAIYISAFTPEDANGDIIEFSDDNPLYLQDICYINGYSSGDGLGNSVWNDYGSYVWSNVFCYQLSNEP